MLIVRDGRKRVVVGGGGDESCHPSPPLFLQAAVVAGTAVVAVALTARKLQRQRLRWLGLCGGSGGCSGSGWFGGNGDGVKSMGSCGCRRGRRVVPVPQDVRGGWGGTQTRRIDDTGRAVAENGAIEVGRWWMR